MRFSNDKEGKSKQSNPIKLGLRPNIQQFLIPLIGKSEFGIESSAIIVSFIASFGAVKAVLNLFAGNLSDKWGRKNVLVLVLAN
jgi:MFS family permease